MRFAVLVIPFLLLSSLVQGSEIADTLLSKAAQKAEEKAELAVNDLFNNVEIDLSGFYKGKPSYGISSILPLSDQKNRNSFLQAHISTRADIEMFNLGYVQRHALYDNKLLVGYNFFYDLDLENSHERWGIGTDLLTSLGDIHLNYYDAITNFKVVNGSREYALDGYDIQIAFPLPYLPKSKFYAETFTWNGINSSRDLAGETYSIKNEFPYGITLEFGKTSYDQLSRDQEFVMLNINLYKFNLRQSSIKSELSNFYSKKPYELYTFSDVSERKYEKVRRENKIKKQTNRSGTLRIVGY